MIVEIINVGTELLLGEVVNTNATYLQQVCKEYGFLVYHQSVVGDNPMRLQECLEIAFNRGANCVITTGGLGPTQDDLTKEVSAKYLGLPLLLLPEELQKVKDKYAFLTRLNTIPESNIKQAYFPKESYILENDVGTANGCILENNGKTIINLPGPPKEMKYVVEHSLKPYLEPLKKETLFTREYTTMGIGESSVDDILKDIINSQTKVSIALYASEEVVRIRLGCLDIEEEKAMAKIDAVAVKIMQRIGDFIVPVKNLNVTVFSMMPAYHFSYHSDFQLPDDFILGNTISKDKESLEISIDKETERLGEVIIVTFKYLQKEHQFVVPLLKQAELSMQKLKAKIVQQLYLFLKS